MSIINIKSLTTLNELMSTGFEGLTEVSKVNLDSLVKLSRAGNNIAGVAEDATSAWKEEALLDLKRKHATKVAEFDLPSN